MPTSTYYQRLLFSCLLLLVLIAGLSFALYNNGPRGRLVRFSDDPKTSALTKGTSMTVAFDRPIEQKDYTSIVTVHPKVTFSTKTNTQSITLTFNENLTHGADYTVTVLPEVYDQSGKKMQSEFSHSFLTAAPAYAYIERNYEAIRNDTDQSSDTVKDHIRIAQVGSEPQSLFSHSEVRSFAANKDYVVVVVREKESDEIYTIDLQTNEARHEQLFLGGRIGHLTLSARGQVALFTVRPDFSKVSAEYYERFANRIESLNVETGEIKPLTDEEGEYIKARDISLDRDGQVALVQYQTQAYYAVSPFNDYDPALIGSHDVTFGFNDTTSEILFRDREVLVRYDTASGDTTAIDLDIDWYAQVLSAQNGPIFISSSSYARGALQSKIQKYSDWESEATTVWESSPGQTSTLRDFTESYDNNFIAIQLNPESCRYDAIGINSQCETVSTAIFDIAKQETVEEFTGFGLTWLP